jgi:putative ABC transport system permease protein
LLSFKETFPSSIRENLWILFGAVGLLLLIACANVSNLLLAKASERQKETMRVPLPEQRYPDSERRVAFFQELLRRGSAVPGVEAVGLNSGVHPLGNMGAPVEVVGSTQQDTRPVVIHQINTDYTKALGIALVEGRLFAESEVYGKQQLAVVNRSFARSRLDGRDAPGRVIRVPRLKQPPFGVTDDSFQVVGVVKDRLNRGLTNEVTPEVYLPFTLTGRADRLVALAQADPASITKAVMSQVYSIDKDQPVTDVRTIDRVLQEGVYAGPRFNLALFAVFAALGLALAVIGVYGVMSSAVAQQTHEIGVRMALGATPGKVSGMVVKRGLWLLLAGIAVGLLGSFLTARLLAGQIWNVSPFDPVTFSAVSLILLVAGLQACVWPARRAARIDPIAALRQE